MPSLTAKTATYTYDGLGRTRAVAHAGGYGASTTTYFGEAQAANPQRYVTTSTDPAGKWKRYYTDGLGQLVKVVEPNPAGGEWDTTYTYHTLGKLKTVTMTRGGVTQTRTFNYNANGQLTSAQNPENGTVTYAYKATGQLDYKIDAKNNKEVYTYDAFARVTSIARYTNLTTPAGTDIFYFDNDSWRGSQSFTQNGAGRLVSRTTSTRDHNNYEMYFTEDFSYSASGLVTKKRLSVQKYIPNTSTSPNSLVAQFGYDGNGALTSVAYPSSHVPAGGGAYNTVPAVTATYGRNALGQLFNLSIAGQTVVPSAYYNAAGQQLQMTWDGWTEDHWFNNAGQMWKQQIKNGSNTVIGGWEYYFPGTANNGRITGTKDLQSLEEITYQYDALNRLTSATKTGGGWAETYGYDGFGNLNQKGASSWLIDTSTNRLHSSTGATYDANGNLTALPGFVNHIYDAANRITMAHPAQERYAYTADNRRVWKYKVGWGEEVTFWGPNGRLTTYQIQYNTVAQFYFVEQTRNVWFGSKLIRTGPAANPTKIAVDRLGSIRMRQTGNNPIDYLTYAPYGEQRSGPNGEGEKFATYYRDDTGLDYADQRYYSSAWGRFVTPDRARSGLNWYRSTRNDPVNHSDPQGLTEIFLGGDAVSCNTDDGSCLPFTGSYVCPILVCGEFHFSIDVVGSTSPPASVPRTLMGDSPFNLNPTDLASTLGSPLYAPSDPYSFSLSNLTSSPVVSNTGSATGFGGGNQFQPDFSVTVLANIDIDEILRIPIMTEVNIPIFGPLVGSISMGYAPGVGTLIGGGIGIGSFGINGGPVLPWTSGANGDTLVGLGWSGGWQSVLPWVGGQAVGSFSPFEVLSGPTYGTPGLSISVGYTVALPLLVTP